MCDSVCYFTALVCEQLQVPQNGHLTALTARVGQYTQAKCDDGYWFEKNVFQKMLLCQNDVTWSDVITDCKCE